MHSKRGSFTGPDKSLAEVGHKWRGGEIEGFRVGRGGSGDS